MPEQIIVGAGLSGLVAAITLARWGYDVRVLEKYGTIGGQPERWPAVDVTPMVPEKISQYIGIPVGEPQVKKCKTLKGYYWGMPAYDVPLEGTNLCCVERGPRKTALDGYLFALAQEAGIKFEFDHPVHGQGAIAALPPDTIIATGLYADVFDALNIPYQMGRCYGAKGRSNRDAEAAIWFGEFTTDYAYWSSMNGIDMIFFFKRGPISADDLTSFEKVLKETECLEAGEWLEGYGPTPTARLDNPRLFASDKILAGTISGMIEPFALFGVHGALVSGAIAALAVEDKNAAWREHRLCLNAWRRMLLNRRVYDRMSDGMRRTAVVGLNEALEATGPRHGGMLLGSMFQAVPGYHRVRSMRPRAFDARRSVTPVRSGE